MTEHPDIDIKENYIKCLDDELLSILLKDRSSGKNIIWATDTYAEKGAQYDAYEHITVKLITGRFGKVIRPRIDKSQKEQKIRIKDKAEVFTPSWICNEMNNHLSDEWFEKKNVFNTEKEKTWITSKNKIQFSNEDGKTWQDYVKSKVLEISCGEAPFLVSRYDTTTGQWIEVNDRIGALDRKLRVVNEQCDSEPDWYNWTLEAFKSTYGYEWQGDSLLIARENLLFTFIDYYIAKFENFPIKEYLIEVAKILSWNIWQMDGLKYVIPNSCTPTPKRQMSLFQDEEDTEPCAGCIKNDNSRHTGIYCKIMNWDTKRTIKFFKGEKRMKFDFVIGNPPYQETINKTENQTQANSTWIYPYFQLSADKIGKCSCLIYPFGGWFDSPNRLGGLGNIILKDGHTILVHAYEGTSDRRAWYRRDKLPQPIFGENANLSAGVSIVLRNESHHDSFEYSNRIYSDAKVNVNINEADDLTPNPLFISINKKLGDKKLISQIKKGIFGIESNFVELNPDKVSFKKEDWENPIQLLTNDKSGSTGRAQLYWTDRQTIKTGAIFLNFYKVVLTSAYPKQKLTSGTPTIANVLSRINELVEILPFGSAFGRSRMALFMSIDKNECDNFIKYMKTSFFAGLTLQEPNRSSTFGEIIPIQDFSSKSDIDWTKDIKDIDSQLYKKYKLTQEEINFIESNTEEMN